MKIYGIVDNKADEIVDIFTRANDASCVRDIKMMAEKNPTLKKFPTDFDLHCFAEIEKSHLNYNVETKLLNIGSLVEAGEVKDEKSSNIA